MPKQLRYIVAAILSGFLLLFSGCSIGGIKKGAEPAICDFQYMHYGYPEESVTAHITYNANDQNLTIVATYGEKNEVATYTCSYDQLIVNQTPIHSQPENPGWTKVYDEAGKLQSAERIDFEADIQTKTSFFYDQAESPVSCTMVREKEGDIRQWNYTFSYDENGRLTEAFCEGDYDMNSIIRWTYDKAGRIIEKVSSSDYGSGEYINNRFVWSYNEAGKLTAYQWCTGNGELLEQLLLTYTQISASPEEAEVLNESLLAGTIGTPWESYYDGCVICEAP